MKTYVQRGETLPHTNTTGATIPSGTVVPVGNQVGVALADIPDGEVGVLAMEGVFAVPKVAGAVIQAGEMVAWDASAGAFDDSAMTPASGDITGACTAWEAAGSGAEQLAVKINTGMGTVA